MNNTSQERDTFVKSFRKVIDSVLLGELNFEEFGLFQFLLLTANPYNGMLVTNYSDLANRLRLKPDKTRYLCEKLKDKEKIWYELKQGQKELTKFYVNGFPLANGSYINMFNSDSEVVSQIPKTNSYETSKVSGVSYEELESVYELPNKEKDKEKEKEKHNIDVLVNTVLKKEPKPHINQEAIIRKIAEWMQYPAFKPKINLEQTEAILGSIAARNGIYVLYEAFNETAKGANPSVKRFWEVLNKKTEHKKGNI